MLIEVLYIPGCCNHKPVLDRIRRVLSLEGTELPIIEVRVAEEGTARSLRFPGSPTVRINGVDVEPSTTARFGLACRLYADGTGLPSEVALQQAMSAARNQEQGTDVTVR